MTLNDRLPRDLSATHHWRPSRSEDLRKLGPQKAQTLPHGNAALQQEGTNLIDDASALADQPFPHPV